MSGEGEARERILDAAARLFAQKGFAATTVRDIAAAAGINLAMIHYYFGNKDGLYRAIFEEKIQAKQRLLEEMALGEGTCRERLERFIRAHAKFLCEHAHFARLIQHEFLAEGTILREVFRPQVGRNYAALRGILEEGVKNGEFRPIDLDLGPISVVGMTTFFVLAQPVVSSVTGLNPDDDGIERRLADHTVNVLMNGLLAEESESR